jgi:AraC-like DNA-binding protein
MTTIATDAPVERLVFPVAGVRGSRFHTRALHRGIKESFAIVLVDSGRSEWWGRGRTWRSGPGTVALKQPGDVHRDLARDGVSTFQVILFDAALVEEARASIGGHGPAILRRGQIEVDDPAGAPFRRLHALAGAGGGLAAEEAVAEALGALARELTGREPEDPRGRWRRPVRRAVELMRARLGERLTLDEIARHAQLDKFHMARAFRAEVGLPPHAYLTHLRMGEARELLAAGIAPSEVAARVGLYDQSQLHRHFLRIVGTTPGRFARAARAQR